ncbi:helix-turn-helix transcriptional regulator [Bacillus sp. RO1]|uniref:helix-turn-helix domain-containing protein n=1 Tax=Bacillus sp. RO1 TaxID=2722703 RepID=UPI001456325C|nr:helix-turn-helix transcriptional regulator [Bacillus sp. RO1]NLP51851.1 helix-turn-helix transcriptional regulator [Bacillus sp. RO1]
MDEKVVIKVFGRVLKRHRDLLDVGQEQMEEDADIGQKSLTRFENGKRVPNFMTMYKLRTGAQLSIDKLIDETHKELMESGFYENPEKHGDENN